MAVQAVAAAINRLRVIALPLPSAEPHYFFSSIGTTCLGNRHFPANAEGEAIIM